MRHQTGIYINGDQIHKLVRIQSKIVFNGNSIIKLYTLVTSKRPLYGDTLPKKITDKKAS